MLIKKKKNRNVQKPQLINHLKNIENNHTKIYKLWKQIAKLINNYKLTIVCYSDVILCSNIYRA